jgi:hypothetical protein
VAPKDRRNESTASVPSLSPTIRRYRNLGCIQETRRVADHGPPFTGTRGVGVCVGVGVGQGGGGAPCLLRTIRRVRPRCPPWTMRRAFDVLALWPKGARSSSLSHMARTESFQLSEVSCLVGVGSQQLMLRGYAASKLRTTRRRGRSGRRPGPPWNQSPTSGPSRKVN